MSKRNQPKLTCKVCHHDISRVLAKDLIQPEDCYRRVRRCERCGSEYETHEIVVRVVKSATSRGEVRHL